MPVFLKDGRSVLFVHIPKTGGTSLEKLFTRSGWAMEGRVTPNTDADLYRRLRCSPQHFHLALLEQVFRLDRFDLVFLVTRDPVARFRSEYVMRNASPHFQPPSKQPDGSISTEPGPVSQFWDWAMARYDLDPYTLDNHLRPQSEFLVPGAEVYRMEDGLDAVAADLNGRFDLGLEGDLPHALRSRRLAGVRSSNVAVSPALLERIGEFYRSDYERLGYALSAG